MKNLIKKIYRYIFSKIIWEIYKRKKITATIIFPEPIPVQKNKPKLKDNSERNLVKTVSIESAMFALTTDGTNPIKTVSAVSAIFASMVDTDTDLKKQNKQRKKFYLKLDGIVFPEAWDDLSEEYKKERLDRLDKIGLDT